jgi:lipopolysaccharide transport protein LptA
MISRRLDASGGVRAELARSSGFSMIRPKDEEDEPVRVTSDTAMWLTRSREFAFTGEVRAWQGEDFVVAESLRGEEGGKVLSAEGDVKSVVAARDLEEGEERGPDSSPIEVTAGKLFYRRQERVVHYTGSPVARQAGRILRCSDLRLFLSPSSDLERLVCEGNVSVEDPSASRSVRGERAEYRPDAAVVEVSGNPAVLRDPAGNEVRGPTIVYDLERQTARVTTAVRPQPPPEEPDE